METVTNQKFEYLTQASLEILHETSHEWLSEMAFMKEEIVFLTSLLMRNPDHHSPSIESIEVNKELTSFCSDILTVLNKKVMEHELWLSDIIRTDTLSRQKFYREIHGELAAQMNDCHNRFMHLKEKIFSFVKHNLETNPWYPGKDCP